MLVESTLRPSVMPRDVEAMSPLLRGTLSALRRWIRWTQTGREHVPTFERALRACLMVPAFSLLLAILRVRALRWGRPKVLGMTADGDTFQCRPPDLVQLYVWLFGVWEPDLTEFIRGRLDAGDTFVDVGANIGVFTLLASRRVGPTGGRRRDRGVTLRLSRPARNAGDQRKSAKRPACQRCRRGLRENVGRLFRAR